MSHHTTASPGDPTDPDDVCAHLDMGHSVMSMAFHLGYCENVMFGWWKIRDVGTLIASCVVIFAIAACYELLKYYREYLWAKSTSCNCSPDKTHSSKQSLITDFKSGISNKLHVIQTILHVLQVIISYFLMLIFMTYNFWLCLAVVLGAGVGFFLFGWDKKTKSVTVTEHCH